MTNFNYTADQMKQAESNLYSALGDGVKALVNFEMLVQECVAKRNTDRIKFHIARVNKNKRDGLAIKAYTTILKHVFPGIKLNTTAGEESVVIKGVQHDQGALDTLEGLVRDGYSLRGTKLGQEFGTDEEKEFNVETWADRAVKAHPEYLEQMIAALQARRPGNIQVAA